MTQRLRASRTWLRSIDLAARRRNVRTRWFESVRAAGVLRIRDTEEVLNAVLFESSIFDMGADPRRNCRENEGTNQDGED